MKPPIVTDAALASERRASLWLLAACAFVALAYVAIAHAAPYANWSPDSDLKEVQIESLRWDGGLRWDLPYAARPLDPSMAHVPVGPSFYELRDGKLFLVWPLLFPLLSWPFFRLLGASGFVVVPLVAGVAITYFTGRTSEVLRRGSGALAALVVGLATPLLVYSTLLWEHTLAVLGGTIAMWALVTQRVRPSSARLVVGGAALGIAAGAVRADVYTFAAALVGAVVLVEHGRARVRVLATFGGALLAASAVCWSFNVATTGHPLPLNAAKNFSTLMTTYFEGHQSVPLGDLAVGMQSPPMLVELCVAATVGVLAVDRSRRPRAFLLALAAFAVATFLVARMRAVRLDDVTAFHGFLATAPVVVLGLLRERDDEPERGGAARTLWLGGVLYVALYFAAISLTTPFGPNGGGVEWGPRFFLSSYPLFTVLAVRNAGRIAERLATRARLGFGALAAVLVLTGAWMNRIALRVVHGELAVRVALRHDLDVSAPLPLVVDVWWMGPTMLSHFEGRQTLYFELDQAASFDAWLRSRAQLGLREIELVSFIRPEEHPFLAACRDGRTSCKVQEERQGAQTAWLSRVSVDAAVPPPNAAP